jgi:hypothetical protein
MRPDEPRHLEPVLGPRTVSETVRASDFVGRNGGEEFIILLPNTDTQHATAVADKILGAVAAITLPGVERDITASLGIATIPDHAADGDQLVRSADRALYVAKTNGRNRAEVAVTAAINPPPSDVARAPTPRLARPTYALGLRPWRWCATSRRFDDQSFSCHKSPVVSTGRSGRDELLHRPSDQRKRKPMLVAAWATERDLPLLPAQSRLRS